MSRQAVPPQGRIWVYIPDRAGKPPEVESPPPDAEYPLLQSYIDVVI